VLVLLVVGAVALAILKPWAPPETPAPTRPPVTSEPAPTALPSPAAVQATAPGPSPSPTLWPWDDPHLFHCVGVRSWLLVTDEVQRQGPIRAWISIDPVIGATGPDDPSIPWYRIAAASVPGIGVCLPNAPAVPGASPLDDAAGTTIVVRRPRDASGPIRGPWEEVHVAPHAGDVAFAGGAMVAPDRTTGDGTWAPGDYLVEVKPGYVGPSAWFGLHVGTIAGPAPSPSPTASPSPGA
jgi:hypothetical protein